MRVSKLPLAFFLVCGLSNLSRANDELFANEKICQGMLRAMVHDLAPTQPMDPQADAKLNTTIGPMTPPSQLVRIEEETTQRESNAYGNPTAGKLSSALEGLSNIHMREVRSADDIMGVYQAIRTARDSSKPGEPRAIGKVYPGIAVHHGQINRDTFVNDVKTQLTGQGSDLEVATKEFSSYTVTDDDLKEKIYARLWTPVNWGTALGVTAGVAGAFSGADPLIWGASAFGAGVLGNNLLQRLGIGGLSSRIEGRLIEPGWEGNLILAGKTGSVLLHDPDSKMSGFLHYPEGEKDLHAYLWYHPESTDFFELKGSTTTVTPPPAPVPTPTRSPAPAPSPVPAPKPVVTPAPVPSEETAVKAPKVTPPKTATVEPAPAPKPVPPVKKLDREAILAMGQTRIYGFRPMEKLPLDEVTIAAGKVFNNLFESAKDQFIEREELLTAARDAILEDRHILMVGPPGTSKTRFATGILSAFRDAKGKESVFFSKPITAGTTDSDLLGPSQYKDGQLGGRRYSKGMLGRHFAFLDEIFSAPLRVLSSILTALSDRKDGSFTGKLKSTFAATNFFFPQLYKDYGADATKQVIDRFSRVVYVANGFDSLDANERMFDSHRKPQLHPVEIEKLLALQAEVPKVPMKQSVRRGFLYLFQKMKGITEREEARSVKEFQQAEMDQEADIEPPYRASRVYSNRTQNDDIISLKALALQRELEKEKPGPVAVEMEDIPKLLQRFSVTGLSTGNIDSRLQVTTSPYERSQLRAMKFDRSNFETESRNLLRSIDRDATVSEIAKLSKQAEAAKKHDDEGNFDFRSDLIERVVQAIDSAMARRPGADTRPEQLTLDHVAATVAVENGQALLQRLLNP